jgi:hypothetical protein
MPKPEKRPHRAKPTTVKTDKPRLKKGGRNERRYAKYRARRGRPNGPGMPGNKSGKNKIRS